MPRSRDFDPIIYPPPYISFPGNPQIINIGKHEVLEYITPEDMYRYILGLAEKVDLYNYETVLVNLNGGKYLFRTLANLSGYTENPMYIEYHRPNGGFGAEVVTPVPPSVRGTKALVIDDIYDSGGVLRSIMRELSPGSMAAVAVTKRGIDGQIVIPNVQIAVEIDNVWIGGCGMDLGMKGEEQIFREHPGIVVKLQ